MDSRGLLRLLETDSYRRPTGGPQIVTLVITMEDLLSCPQCEKACAEEMLVEAMDNYAAILAGAGVRTTGPVASGSQRWAGTEVLRPA